MIKCPYCKKEVVHKKKHFKSHHPNIYEKIYNFVLDNHFYKVQGKPISLDCRFIQLENKSEYHKNHLD